MGVLRIVSNIAASDLASARVFYEQILGLKELMNHGWIVTYGSVPDLLSNTR